MLHSGYVEYAFFTGMPRYKDLFRTSSQWWAYNDCVQRCAAGLRLAFGVAARRLLVCTGVCVSDVHACV